MLLTSFMAMIEEARHVVKIAIPLPVVEAIPSSQHQEKLVGTWPELRQPVRLDIGGPAKSDVEEQCQV